MILTQALAQAGLKNPGAPAILDLGKTISFSEMRKKISQLSYLHQAEVGHGKRVAFLAQNTQITALSFFAFSNIGCPSIFLDPAETPEAIAHVLKELEITHLAVSNDQLSRANDLLRVYGLNVAIVEIDKKKGGEYDESYSPPPDHPLKETDPVLIVRHEEYGQPVKYIFFTHTQLYAASAAVRKFYRFAATERVLTTMSWAHPFALTHGLLTPLFAGVTCAVNPQSASNDEFLTYLAEQHVSRFADSPKFFYFLLSIAMTAKSRLPGVKSVTVGAGTMPKALRKTFGLLNIPVLQTHGRTEAVWTLAMEDREKAGSGSLEPLPGLKYKVLNEAGDEAPGPGFREGPLAVAGECVMSAFFHPDKAMAEKASKLTVRGTWFYTGEGARLEGEGEELKIKALGPVGDLIRGSGKYLTTEKIDESARSLTGVSDAAAFVRTNDKGEAAFALAAVPEGKGLTEAIVIQQLGQRLNGPQLPRSVHFVDAIPRDRFDNVNRAALQRQFSAR
jgi:acyl-CoA synthetase (AMP-forming)/AMP-acid ligase II